MNKIYCVGEALIDMYGDVPRVGGAPANVAACVAKLGGDCAFIGGISDDSYGKLIYRSLAALGVDMTYAKIKSAPTATARVHLDGAERKFAFCRQNTADLMLSAADIEYIPFEEGDILHFCSNCLMHDGMRDVHDRLIRAAKAAGAVISYDVNLRPALWQDEQTMLEISSNFLPFADIVKVSEEEKALLFEGYGVTLPVRDFPNVSVGNVFDLCSGASCVIETKGSKGARCYFAANVQNGLLDYSDIFETSALNPNPVDTTGAGDCFIGVALEELARAGFPYKKYDMEKALDFASHAAAFSVSKMGAIASYPSREELAASQFAM